MKKTGDIIGEGVLGILGLIVFAFNFFAGIVGGIWLLCLGHWRIVLSGFLASLSLPWWWFIVSLPSLGLGGLYILFADKKHKAVAAILVLIAGLYDSFLIIGWLSFVFIFFLITSFEKDITPLPMLLYAYSVATSPFTYMASQEQEDSINTNLTVFIIVTGSILVVILSLFGVPLIYPLILLCILMISRTLLLTVLGVSMITKKGKAHLSDTQTRCQQDEVYDQEIEEGRYNQDDNLRGSYEKCNEEYNLKEI